jgi:hypothetical protein
MITKSENVKKQFLDYVFNNFFKEHKEGVSLPLIDDFLDFLDGMKKYTPGGFTKFMASLIYDTYELLQWRKTLNIIYEEENVILGELDNATSIEQAINSVLTEDNVVYFMTDIYFVCIQTLGNRINFRNHFRHVKVNDVIVKSDTLAIANNYMFYKKGYIFHSLYHKEQYIQLLKALMNELKSKDDAFTMFLEAVSGMKHYNESQYIKLILDMCEEFLFQKYICGEYNENNNEEKMMLELIEKYDIDIILQCVSNNLFLKEVLANCYVDYDHFDDEERKQLDTLPPESNVSMIIKKLHHGKEPIKKDK